MTDDAVVGMQNVPTPPNRASCCLWNSFLLFIIQNPTGCTSSCDPREKITVLCLLLCGRWSQQHACPPAPEWTTLFTIHYRDRYLLYLLFAEKKNHLEEQQQESKINLLYAKALCHLHSAAQQTTDANVAQVLLPGLFVICSLLVESRSRLITHGHQTVLQSLLCLGLVFRSMSLSGTMLLGRRNELIVKLLIYSCFSLTSLMF